MKIEKLFKRLVIFYGIFFILMAFVFWDLKLEIFLFGEIFQENYTKISNAFPETETNETFENFIAISMLFIIIIYLISLYRLFKFKSYARELFIFCLFALYFLTTASEYPSFMYLITLSQELFLMLSYLMEGAIIVFIYFTPIKDKFKKN